MNRRSFFRATIGWGVAAAVAPPLIPEACFIGHLELVKLLGRPMALRVAYAKDPTRYGYTLSRPEVEEVLALAFFNPSGYLTASEWSAHEQA